MWVWTCLSWSPRLLLFAKSSRSHVSPHSWRWQCAGIGLALFIRGSDQPCYIKQRATHWTTKQKCLQIFVMDYFEIRPDHCSNFLLLWLFCVCLLYSQIMLFIIKHQWMDKVNIKRYKLCTYAQSFTWIWIKSVSALIWPVLLSQTVFVCTVQTCINEGIKACWYL